MRFSSAHHLRDYVGKCAKVHGHNYVVQIQVHSHQLDAIGLAMDYYDLKRLLKKYVDQLDHCHLNEIKPFDSINPTAEHLAAWFYRQLHQEFTSMDAPAFLVGVTIWENDDFSVTYSETSHDPAH